MLRRVEDDAAPGLGRLDVLASTTTAAGVPTGVRVVGRPRPLAATVDLAAFRIVQESLANVLRHAGPASALITIVYDGDVVIVEVEDDGSGETIGSRAPSAGSGHGIVGMRERALAVGGELETCSRPERGFCVRARLPVSGRS
jgi:signal transduction histidine kinase